MKLTKTQNAYIESSETLQRLKTRMLEREGKSEETLRRYLDGPHNLTEFLKAETPDEAMEKLRQSKDITQILDDWIAYLQKSGKTPINIKALVFGAKKWLFANRVNGVDWDFIGKPKVVCRIEDRIPRIDELRVILSNKVSLRDKSLFMTAASSGLRLGTLTTLQVKDFSRKDELGMINVNGGEGRKLAKGRSYYTFVTPETRATIEEYLSTRENLTLESALFASPNGLPIAQYVSNTSRAWRRMLKRAKLLKKIQGHRWIDLHAHVLRKFFQTRCKLAGCQSSFVDFWMGHHPSKADDYLNDSYFRPELEVSMNEYRKAVADLTIFGENTKVMEAQSKELERLRADYENLRNLVQRLLAEKS